MAASPYGRTFEINDLAVEPEYQRRGIAKELLEKCLADIKAQGMVGVHLITAREGVLPAFYAKKWLQKRNSGHSYGSRVITTAITLMEESL